MDVKLMNSKMVWLGVIGGLVMLLMGIPTSGICGDNPVGNKIPLKLRIVKTDGFAGDIAVMVLLENVGNKDITILKEFNPHPIFFSFNLVKSDGTPIDSPGGGKISFDRKLKYVTLEPNELIGVEIPLKSVIENYETLKKKKGEYKLSVEYHNQYGSDCFQGRITSNSISFTIPNSK